MWHAPTHWRQKLAVGASIAGRATRCRPLARGALLGMVVLAMLLAVPPMRAVKAQDSDAEFVGPYPGTISWQTDYSFHDLVGRLQKSVAANGMTVLATSSATVRGGGIPDNAVLLVFRNDYAVRMVQASALAGMEAPIRLYVTAGPDKKATIIYRTPTSIFALYDNPKLDELAAEMDQIFAKIVDDAISS
jgi:uncharacterized protein (DUF302 family)